MAKKELDIDIKEIMRQIKQQALEKMRDEQYATDFKKLEKLNPEEILLPDLEPIDIKLILQNLKENYNIETFGHRISSRKVLGNVVNKIRNRLQLEITYYLDPVISKQVFFNQNILQATSFLNNELLRLKKQYARVQNELRDNTVDINYLSFENEHRGSEQEIKDQLRMFIDYFKDQENVLDIGCGRGEFLELLRERDIKALGVDIDNDMIELCKKKKLNVIKADIFDYLRKVPDKSLGGIFCSQVIEHLPAKNIVKLVRMCFQKLKPDCWAAFISPNPESLAIFRNAFYVDLSHIKPIHPEALKFVMKEAGFKQVVKKSFSPIPESDRLSLLANTEKNRTMNYNLEKLNAAIFGDQDYLILGKK